MALVRQSFSTGSLGNGSVAPTLHAYLSTDTKLSTGGADYFLALNDVLNVGDFIIAYCSDGGVLLAVSAVSETEVTTVATT